MEPFIVSARKYRPKTFKDVVGQQAITNTLLNAIDSNHLAQALLFCGPRGVGKTTCARILAKQINQDDSQNSDEDFAFNIFELDAASNNSVDDIRSLIDQVRIPPQVGKYKVYIIDEVHMLTQSAFNAFLKTLEEPPKHAIFILATTEKHKIIPTILSRCQIFDFKRITVKDATEYLKYIAENQGIKAEEEALHIIAQKADGAMRDALSIFDRVVSFSGTTLTRKAVTENLNVLDYDTYFSATDYILEHNIPKALILFNKTLSLGFDGHHFISGLASHFRDLMVCQHQETIPLLEVGEVTKKKYQEQAKKASASFLLQALDIANDCDLKYKTSKNQRLLVELTLMKLSSINFDGEKKNPESVALHNKTISFIAPASFFHSKKEKSSTNTVKTENSKPIVEEQQETVLPQNTVSTLETKVSTITKEVPTKTPTPKKIDLKNPTKRVSGLSISSLKAKKEHELNKKELVIDESKLPKDIVSEEKLQKLWAEFVNVIDAKGQKILASNLNADIPKLKNETSIHIELPNDTMRKEVEREQYELMEFLKKQLNNYFLELKIKVNETTETKFAFTPEEKYEKLRQKNPVIDLLRKEFDMDLT
ncbi:DNA polymerase-3 subunit gamma/tau [Maribacter vaceletii]|uniref:DNA polymerase III subunit gamma/tau n=1 Tax=Maribacter vaceletii TaxID=1206816 RepID=A0A495DWU7_9FLAO|nr:DNA polymerase III subunit gamma/tau [Maribacter vaceletii]RKR08087.1 DNA polymerase-3 subunit gamma/tau [Maribacter vaceletii]